MKTRARTGYLLEGERPKAQLLPELRRARRHAQPDRQEQSATQVTSRPLILLHGTESARLEIPLFHSPFLPLQTSSSPHLNVAQSQKVL
jgi:hypothetical protein